MVKVNGRLILDDGPYQGMSVEDYRDFIKSYRKSVAEYETAKLLKVQEVARKAGQPIPKRLPLRQGVHMDASNIPAWPTGIRNYRKEPETGVEILEAPKPIKRMNVNIDTI
jgi:hypothetical protein